jgi:hypothetical protein
MADSQAHHVDHHLLAHTQLYQEEPQTFHSSAQVLGTTTLSPLQYTDVYLDDFIMVAQKPLHMPAMNNL